MSTFRKIFAATAVSAAFMMPMVGAAEAKRGDGDRVHHQVVQGEQTYRIAQRRRRLATPVIDRRIANQRRRIRRGRRVGRLTRIEAVRLRSRLFAIRSVRRFARLDGRVTRAERRRMIQMLDTNSKRIRRLSRNGRRS